MTSFIARRNARGNVTLYAGHTRFGTIFLRGNGTISGAAFVDDDVATCFRGLRGMPVDTVPEALARARRAYELASHE